MKDATHAHSSNHSQSETKEISLQSDYASKSRRVSVGDKEKRDPHQVRHFIRNASPSNRKHLLTLIYLAGNGIQSLSTECHS